jgi:predicted TPR repeat methyltransferase
MRSLAKRSAHLCREAVEAHRSGDLSTAQRLYEQSLALRPQDPDTLNYLGLLRYHQGQSAAAVKLLERSLAMAPQKPYAWLNLGHMLMTLDQDEQARAAYERASALEPTLAQAWLSLGKCLRKMQLPAAAAAALDHAIELGPGDAEAWYQRGIARREICEFAEAESDYRAALERNPEYCDVYDSLGALYDRLGRVADAAAVYRKWLELEPHNAIARHRAAATSGENAPERAADDYIVELFERFSSHFESDLISLSYRAPEHVTRALCEAMQPQASLGSVLDAGCGTGLCGERLRPIARHLAGVDLSAAMIAEARPKNCYDELQVGELCEYMRSRPRAFDAVVSADTLVYFGALEEPLAAAAICLRGEGVLVMTLEALAADESVPSYRLCPHGRYAHRIEYVQSALDQAGFGAVAVAEQVLRRERGEDVRGFVVTARLHEDRVSNNGWAL